MDMLWINRYYYYYYYYYCYYYYYYYYYNYYYYCQRCHFAMRARGLICSIIVVPLNQRESKSMSENKMYPFARSYPFIFESSSRETYVPEDEIAWLVRLPFLHTALHTFLHTVVDTIKEGIIHLLELCTCFEHFIPRTRRSSDGFLSGIYVTVQI